ncbi:MAG: beta-galactosidase trimerization domain-containing protein, partial [Pseudomonadota bacterium]
AGTASSPVGLIFDYESAYAWEAQPQGKDFDYFHLVYEFYRALRALGLNIDILPPDGADCSAYDIVFAPGLLHLNKERCAAYGQTRVVYGPRTGLKTDELSVAVPLGPGIPGLDLRITHVESLPPAHPIALEGGGLIWKWIEHVEGEAEVREVTRDGLPVLLGAGPCHYLTGWPDAEGLKRLTRQLVEEAGLTTLTLPEHLRVRETATHRFWINYGAEAVTHGDRTIAAADVIWERL